MPLILSALNVHTGLRNTCTLLVFEVICLDWIDILWTYAKLGDVGNFKRLKYLQRLWITLASWALDNLVVEMGFVDIAWLRTTLLHSLLACFVRAIPLNKLWNQLFADLRGALVRQNAPVSVVPVLVWNHVGKVTVFHWLVQFQVLHPLLEQLVVVLKFHFVIHE